MTHDEYYIKYLQSMFGNTTVSFFGIIISIITLILICVVIMLNSTTVFVTPIIKGSNESLKLPTTKPIVF